MHRAISVIDLLSFPESRDIVQSGNKAEFVVLLHNIGFDIKQPIDYQICFHRAMIDNDVYYSGRWVGSERGDNEWLKSEYCTLENKIEKVGTKDLALQEELTRISSLPNYTAMTIEKMRVSREEYELFDEHLDIISHGEED
jgi:hypothetical protein